MDSTIAMGRQRVWLRIYMHTHVSRHVAEEGITPWNMEHLAYQSIFHHDRLSSCPTRGYANAYDRKGHRQWLEREVLLRTQFALVAQVVKDDSTSIAILSTSFRKESTRSRGTYVITHLYYQCIHFENKFSYEGALVDLTAPYTSSIWTNSDRTLRR